MPDKELDVFISYRRHDKAQVEQLAHALAQIGLCFWLDRNEIGDAASIQQRIDQGLAQAKVLLAWYSTTYPHSRACQWELTAALIATTAETGPIRRVLVVNPEADVRHIEPIQLRDLQHFHCTDDFLQLAERIADAIRPISGTLGNLRRLHKPRWHGLHGLGSNRFTGRERDLWAIHSALTSGNFSIIAGLPGPGASADLTQVRGSGGIGKSLLAEEYGLRFGPAWPGGVFWFNAYGTDEREKLDDQVHTRREAAYGRQLAAIAQGLGLDICDKSDQELRAAIGRNLTEPALWIVDDLSACSRMELERWIAPSPLAYTLITTRSKCQDGLGTPIDLGSLDSEAARSLLTLDHLPQPEEEEAVDAILNLLDGHALALDVARSACRRLGYLSFHQRLLHPDTDALELAAQLKPDLPNDHNPSIAATLLSAIRHLDDSGLDVLRLAACLASAPISQDLIAACLAEADRLDPILAEEHAALGLQQVLDHSLAEESDTTTTFTVHALVTRTINRHGKAINRQSALRTAALTVINQRMEAAADIRQHASLAPILPHAQVLATYSKDVASLNLAGWLGSFEMEAGRYTAAQNWYESEYQGRILLLGNEHPDTLISMNNLAVILNNLGEFQGSKVLQEKILELRIHKFGEEHPDTLISMGNFATTLMYMGNLQGALELHNKGLEICIHLFGEEHPITCTFMDNLATTLREKGELSGARALMEKELEICSRVLGEEHPKTLISIGNMASTLRAQGDLQGARMLGEKGLDVCYRILGEKHPVTLTFMGNLASTLKEQGLLHNARVIMDKELKIRIHVLGEKHPETLTSMGNLALALRDEGNLQDARALQERALEISAHLLGEEHPDTLLSMNNLALTLMDQGNLQGARVLMEKVMAVRIQILGEEHPGTVNSMETTASILRSLNDMQGARVLLEKTLEFHTRLFGKEHPKTLTTMSNLAGILWNQGDLIGARSLEEKVLEIRTRILGKEHPDTLTSMNNLAETIRTQGDLQHARMLQEKTLEVCIKILGEEHPDTCTTAWNLFNTLDQQNEYKAAQALLNTHLLWLLERDLAGLNSDQQQIRNNIKGMVRLSSANPTDN